MSEEYTACFVSVEGLEHKMIRVRMWFGYIYDLQGRWPVRTAGGVTEYGAQFVVSSLKVQG
jgi:hypothetical protein